MASIGQPSTETKDCHSVLKKHLIEDVITRLKCKVTSLELLYLMLFDIMSDHIEPAQQDGAAQQVQEEQSAAGSGLGASIN
uniref:Uncharacterized protein n=1 Tax=Ditylenchus dipsaci TaxID=166011 RepID=A0A915D4V4_9BILA